MSGAIEELHHKGTNDTEHVKDEDGYRAGERLVHPAQYPADQIGPVVGGQYVERAAQFHHPRLQEIGHKEHLAKQEYIRV